MKVLCRWHDDRHPTMEVYPDGGYCFSCGKQATLQELGMDAQDLPPAEPPEDLEETYRYINSLPIVNLRGLRFPADEHGYYITWLDRSYYKKRLYDDSTGRYRSPRGHKEPMFWARLHGWPSLIVVEGQINALSVLPVTECQADVCSPGGVGNFYRKLTRGELTEYYRYSTIVIVCDEDGPGAKAAINLYSQLIGKGRTVRMKLMKPDANDVLCGINGKEELRKTIQGELRAALEGST